MIGHCRANRWFFLFGRYPALSCRIATKSISSGSGGGEATRRAPTIQAQVITTAPRRDSPRSLGAAYPNRCGRRFPFDAIGHAWGAAAMNSTILVIEESLDLCRLFEYILRADGHTVAAFHDWQTAQSALAEVVP